MNQSKFILIVSDLEQGKKVAEIAVKHHISQRQVHRVKEAGTWERWPYIVAKVTYGYRTPEYKLYLKRRGLPLLSPPKVSVSPREQKLTDLRDELSTVLKKRSLLSRLFRRGN